MSSLDLVALTIECSASLAKVRSEKELIHIYVLGSSRRIFQSSDIFVVAIDVLV